MSPKVCVVSILGLQLVVLCGNLRSYSLVEKLYHRGQALRVSNLISFLVGSASCLWLRIYSLSFPLWLPWLPLPHLPTMSIIMFLELQTQIKSSFYDFPWPWYYIKTTEKELMTVEGYSRSKGWLSLNVNWKTCILGISYSNVGKNHEWNCILQLKL